MFSFRSDRFIPIEHLLITLLGFRQILSRVSVLLRKDVSVFVGTGVICSGSGQAKELGREQDKVVANRRDGDVHREYLGLCFLSFRCLRIHYPIKHHT